MLDPHQSMELYKMAEKYPNQVILRLLLVVVMKAKTKTLDEMFQFDIMRMLHGAITGGIDPKHAQNMLGPGSEEDKNARYREQL